MHGQKSFQVEETEDEYRLRKQREKEEYDELVRQQRNSQHLDFLRLREQQALERNRQEREYDEKRRQREEEFQRQKEAALRARREREEALRQTQRELERMVLQRLKKEEDEDDVSEEQLIEKQKRILLMERELQAKKAALEAKLGTRSYEPLEGEYDEPEEGSARPPLQHASTKFVVNPGWGIDSIAQKTSGPLQLVQMRRLTYLPKAPSTDGERHVILVVLSDYSFLCVKEPSGLRLLFPPCENPKVIWGPALALTYETMFSLRFDDLGPFYFLGESQVEVKYWMKMFAPPTMPEL
jgi:hypothetical protein